MMRRRLLRRRLWGRLKTISQSRIAKLSAIWGSRRVERPRCLHASSGGCLGQSEGKEDGSVSLLLVAWLHRIQSIQYPHSPFHFYHCLCRIWPKFASLDDHPRMYPTWAELVIDREIHYRIPHYLQPPT